MSRPQGKNLFAYNNGFFNRDVFEIIGDDDIIGTF